MSIPNGMWPFTCIDGSSGAAIRVAFVPVSGSMGHLMGTWQDPGDVVPSAPFTLLDASTGSPLQVKESRASMNSAYSGGCELVLNVLLHGETHASLWVSTDDARTWSRI